jgi:type I restriction enzyme, S subunit
MGGYQRYEAYRDSGVEWLGEIPVHWKAVNIKYLGEIRYGLGEPPESQEDGIPLIRATDIYRGKIDGSQVQRVNPQKVPWSRKPQLKAKDILVVRSGAYTGDSAIVPDEWSGAIAGYDMVFSATVVQAEFLAFNLLSRHVLEGQIYLAKARAAQPHLNAEELGNVLIAFPPLEEQKSIARFLDYKTAQIDALIAKKESLLKKLAEKRSALISQAVTKGLDPTVPMKDSGVEWLGEIPAHWKVGALGYMCNLVSGGTPDRNKVEFWDGEIPWIKTGEINYQDINDSEERITNLGLANSSACIASPGTLLMAMYGQGNTRGRVSILRIHAAFNQACIAISPQQNINVEFLYYYMIAAYPYIRDSGNESSQMNLSAGLIGKIKIVILPLSEQESLVNYLSQSIRQLDKQMDKVRLAIARLKEYRTALITNAVTGAIDVRNVAIPNDLQEAAS